MQVVVKSIRLDLFKDFWTDLKQSERMRLIIAMQECARKKGNNGGGGDGSGNIDDTAS